MLQFFFRRFSPTPAAVIGIALSAIVIVAVAAAFIVGPGAPAPTTRAMLAPRDCYSDFTRMAKPSAAAQARCRPDVQAGAGARP